jgi:hypothetical protein
MCCSRSGLRRLAPSELTKDVTSSSIVLYSSRSSNSKGLQR